MASRYYLEQTAAHYNKETDQWSDSDWLVKAGLADRDMFEGGDDVDSWRIRREVRPWNEVPEEPFYQKEGKGKEPEEEEPLPPPPTRAGLQKLDPTMTREKATGLIRKLFAEWNNKTRRDHYTKMLDAVPTDMLADIKAELEKEFFQNLVQETPDSEKPLELLEAEKEMLTKAYQQMMNAKDPKTGAKMIPTRQSKKQFALKFKSLSKNIQRKKAEKEGKS